VKLGIIGCGNMGGAMARHLLENGQALVCHDPDAGMRAAMGDAGAKVTDSAATLAAQADVIVLSLPNAAIVRAVMAEITDHLGPGATLLDASTSDPQTSKALHAQGQEHGFHFIDGPVSGGPAAARAGTMTMLLGGDADAIKSIRPLLDLLTAKTVHVGGAGAGHAAKIVNNMLCAANLVLVAEAMRLGAAAGVDPQALLEGINAGSGRSGVSQVNYPKWVLNGGYDSGFTMGLMRKDVGLARNLAAGSDVEMPGFAVIAQIWADSAAALPDGEDFNKITEFQPTEARQ
jgi:3-hydroxyisobutyrate dehydrogenase